MRIFATILQRHAKAACTALALALAAMGVGTATAQNTVITPYSRYGYGILGDNATAAQSPWAVWAMPPVPDARPTS